jgi:hypothetical protein
MVIYPAQDEHDSLPPLGSTGISPRTGVDNDLKTLKIPRNHGNVRARFQVCAIAEKLV